MRDKQEEFLEYWVQIVGVMIAWYVDEVDAFGPVIARTHWQRKMKHAMENPPKQQFDRLTWQFSVDLCLTATRYADLLIRYGVFDGYTTD